VRQSTKTVRRATSAGLKAAVHRSRPLSRAGVLERMFTLAFSKLVYPQIWEDPVVDMAALDIGPGHEVIAIASGGCNVLSYLIADPAGVTAVDLNGAHIALGQLKVCALLNLPDYETFFRFFGRADARANIAVYDQRLRGALDPASRAYWDKRTGFGRRRIDLFARNFYRHGLLGRFLGAGHTLARLHGLDPSIVLKAKTRALREAPCADLREAAHPLDHEAAGVALWTGHSADAVQGARRRFASRNQRRRERARGAAGLRLRHRGELFRLAGVRTPVRAGAEPLAPALSAETELRRRPEPLRPRALCPAVVHRHFAQFRRGEL